MFKRLQKSDYFFIAALLCGLLFHMTIIISSDNFFDEAFYPTVPYRLINDDSLVQHEWHLTQFSSLFLYLPVRLWLLIKGSTEGIYLYLRFVYIFVHSLVTVAVYKFFRNYSIWSVLASMMFYMLIPYRTYALNYTSMLAIFYLLFTLNLFSIYKTQCTKCYLGAGFFYGCCCVNNPIFCIFFVLYVILCVLYTKKNLVIRLLSSKHIFFNKRRKKSNEKSSKVARISFQEKLVLFSKNLESYAAFFNKKAVICSFAGVCIIAAISVVFFFKTGGTLSSIFENIENLMGASEYFTTSKDTWAQKSLDYKTAINSISLNIPCLLPLFFFLLFIDKKKKTNAHRFAYLVVSFALSVLFSVGILSADDNTAFFFSFPFAFFSIVCYILTNKRQTDLFFCIWCPCAASSLLCSFASNTLFYSSSAIFSISNIAGMFFIYDLLKEIKINATTKKHNYIISQNKKFFRFANHIIIVLTISLQLAFSCFTTRLINNTPIKDATFVASSGPLKGMFFNQEVYDLYESILDDLDYVKNVSAETEPLLVIGNLDWAYMYTERPFATYTAYYLGFSDKSISEYYKKNPDKIPKYIYVFTIPDLQEPYYAKKEFYKEKDILDTMFKYSIKDLHNGVLLTVNDYIYQEELSLESP